MPRDQWCVVFNLTKLFQRFDVFIRTFVLSCWHALIFSFTNIFSQGDPGPTGDTGEPGPAGPQVQLHDFTKN